jgi:Kef-type K+ transport system membrane component KefB
MIFFLQMFVILAACRVCGWAVRRFLRQPQVIGEMVAGVILGPSLLGSLSPELQQYLFPAESKPVLHVVAQTGIALYMFLVGLDFRSGEFKSNAPAAVAVSVSGTVVPFIVAVLATPWLLEVPGLFAPGVSRFNATLFLGAAIAITAFPVLARIIHDRGLSGTVLATQALAAAAIGDAVAWCVVAVVLASIGAGAGIDVIGLHAVFGAFLIGTAMPRGIFAQRLRQLLEPFTLVFLLPVFFTYSGLNTQLAKVNTLELLWIAAAVLAASIFAKLFACWAAARMAGQDNRSALGLGALMNARGLTELIIVNIGLQAGIIAPALFSMLVLMAIVTTLMASPLFELFYGRHARRRGEIPALKGLQ